MDMFYFAVDSFTLHTSRVIKCLTNTPG